MKILFLNNGKNFSNWGLQAATDGLIDILKENIKNVEFLYLEQYKMMTKRFNFDPVLFGKWLFNRNSRIAPKLFGYYFDLPRVADEFEFYADKWQNMNVNKGSLEVIHLLTNSDIVIYNAEGSTYRNSTSALRALFILWYAKTKLHKKCFFLNGSVTLTTIDPILPAFLKKSFSVIDGISIREPISYQNIVDWFPELKSKIKMIPDSAFSVDTKNLNISNEVKKLDLKSNYFCFSTSMLPIDYKNTKKHSAIYNLLKEIKEKNNLKNIFILARDIEDQFLKYLAKDLNAVFIGADFSYEDVLYILSKSKFLLSGRYHHLIFATKVGTPAIALNTTSHKNIGLSKLFDGLMNYPFDPTNLWEEKEKILDHIDKILANETYYRNSFKLKSEEYKNTVNEHAKIVLEKI